MNLDEVNLLNLHNLVNQKDVNIKNLIITGTIYTLSGINDPEINYQVISSKFYNINGLEVPETTEGLLIQKCVFENGKVIVQKIFRKKI